MTKQMFRVAVFCMTLIIGMSVHAMAECTTECMEGCMLEVQTWCFEDCTLKMAEHFGPNWEEHCAMYPEMCIGWMNGCMANCTLTNFCCCNWSCGCEIPPYCGG